MRYSTVLIRLQNLINREITQAELCRILNVKQSTMGNRQNRDSNFSEEEIAALKDKGLITQDEYEAKRAKLLEDF